MGNYTEIQDRIREVIRPNGVGAITAAEHQALLLQIVDKLGGDIERLDTGTVQKDGRYPALSAGFADNLTGHGESIPAEFTFRATGGRSIADGVARIKRIKGNSVVWNQGYPYPKFTKKSNWEVKGIATASTSDKGVTITLTGNPDVSYAGYLAVSFKYVKGHKFLVSMDATCAHGGHFVIDTSSRMQEGNVVVNVSPNQLTRISVILTSAITDSESILNLYPSLVSGGYVAGDTFTINNFVYHDLTLMFGVGNEPTTIEEYNARKPIVADEYAYNEGEVIHMNTENIKSVGDNAWDEQWENGYIESTTGEEIAYDQWFRCKNYIKILPNTQYYAKKPSGVFMLPIYYDEEKRFIKSEDVFYTGGEGGNFTTPNASYMRFYCNIPKYNHDIMITLVHSGWKQDTDAGYQPYWQDIRDTSIIGKYFPDGMKSAGDAHDEIRFNKATQRWEWVSRIAAIDMGSLDWFEYLNDYGIMCYSALKWDGIQDTTSNQYAHLLTKLYATQKWDDLYVGAAEGIAFAEVLRVVDSSVSSLAEFKAKVQGVNLYYELTEPTIREISEPFNPDYRVADFGTEEAISSRPSAPFRADIIYQFNAVDMIRELWGMVQTLQAKL